MSICPSVITGGPVSQRDPQDFCALMAAAGIAGVEVGVGRNPQGDQDLATHLARWDTALNDAGLSYSSLNCGYQPHQREDVAEIFRAAADRGVGIVKVDVSPYDSRAPYETQLVMARDSWANLVPLCREYGVKAVAEVHPKIVCHSPSAMRRLLHGLPSECVGAIYDPGNMVYEGWEDTHEAVQILGPYLAHLHVKNGCWERAPQGGWQFASTPLGEGFVDWAEVCRELAGAGYQGWGVLEFLTPEMDNAEWIARDTATLRAAVTAAYGG